ncbi:MAG: metal-dependent transcriptional regulator [Clostridiales bacterium]|nr:metal-dependent transcriptional regulator [Clostridiales bacterium]
MNIYESAEDYLETLLILSKKQPQVISKDIVQETGYSKPSISIAMKKLREKNLVEFDANNNIFLTDEGKKIAENIYEKHLTLTKFFKKLGVSDENATEDACRMEHFISDESYEKIKEWTK